MECRTKTADQELYWRILRRDFLINATWLPVAGLCIILSFLPFAVLLEFGLVTGEAAGGWYGMAMLGCGTVALHWVSRRLARRFGIPCPECGKIISSHLMRRRDRRYWWWTRRCPYCSRD